MFLYIKYTVSVKGMAKKNKGIPKSKVNIRGCPSERGCPSAK